MNKDLKGRYIEAAEKYADLFPGFFAYLFASVIVPIEALRYALSDNPNKTYIYVGLLLALAPIVVMIISLFL